MTIIIKKGKEFLKTQEKYYTIDIGLRYYMLGQGSGKDMGHILENIVYLELLRRGYKVYIGKYDDLEVDFVAKNSKNTVYYQVALTTRDGTEKNKCIRLVAWKRNEKLLKIRSVKMIIKRSHFYTFLF